MAEQTSDHPDPDRLAAFGRGILDQDEMAEVESHLAICESCCQVLSTLPDDKFIGFLRTAQKRSESATSPCEAANQTATTPILFDVSDPQIPSSFVLHGSGSSSNVGATLASGNLSGCESPELSLERELSPELADHPRYRIVKRLGRGGMGTVYLAEHRLMDRPVALKVIRRDLLENEALVERFRREVKAAARLALHPNIVAAYDAEQAGESHFLVMEYVDGVDLARLVKAKGPLPCDLACEAVKQAAEGLEHAYQRGMVHRDIKPQNLMRTPDGQVKVLDFGLARFASEALTELVPADERETGPGTEATTGNGGASITLTNMLLGTADYIAPEQASAPRSADIRADIYSLGCTLYYLLTGQTPFPDGTLIQKIQAHREQMPRSLTVARPDISPELTRVVDRMMAKDRNRRFQRPAEVAEALAPFADAKAFRDLASDVEVAREREDPANAAPSAPTETRADRPWHQPSFKLPTIRRQPRLRVATILVVLIGCVAVIWREAPGLYAAGWPAQAWSVAAHFALLLGCVAYIWIGVAGWPGAAHLALLIGCVGFIRMEVPGLFTAAILALCVGCAGGLGIITFRKRVSALLALLTGCVGFFWGERAGWHGAGALASLIGCIGAIGIITFRQPTIRAWRYLTSWIAAFAAAIALAWLYQVPTEVDGEGILLIENDTLSLVRAPATGKLLSLRVMEGDMVAPGDEIGRISQDDLMDAVRETESKLKDLRHEDQELTQMEERERQNKVAAIARLKQAIPRALDGSPEKLKISQRVAELEQDQISAESSQRRAQLERRVKVRSMETKLALDRDKLERTARVISQVHGRVAELLAARGELVREGAPVVLLHSPRAQTSTSDSGEPLYDSIIFVAAGEGDWIEVGNPVEVVPATVKREEDGFIRGQVVATGKLRASKWTMEEALGHPELADAFLKRHAPGNLLRVLVKLHESDRSGSGVAPGSRGNSFRWSSSHGFMKSLKTGTPCQAAIVVKRRRLITLTIPWTRRLVGVD